MHQKKYKQLGQQERDRIYLLKKQGLTNAAIASRLGRDKSTIGRELRRNLHLKFKQYLPDTAQRKADKRKRSNRKQCYLDKQPQLKWKILYRLKRGWSPDLIAGRLKELKDAYFNQESIYQFIYSLEGRKANLRQYLRRAHRLRHHKQGRKHRANTKIPNRTDIDKRPKFIEKRVQFGHWEGDSVIYDRHRSALSTSVERKTRKVIISRPYNLTAEEKSRILIKRFEPLPFKARRTMTYDNGKEAAAHETVTDAIGMKFFFTKTYSSWQRGTNENRNGLVRYYLPRDVKLSQLTNRQIQRVENLINNRPVKLLGYKTPNEAFAVEMNKLKVKL